MASLQSRKYLLLLLMLFSSIIILGGCINFSPKKINGISLEVQISNNKILPGSVKASIVQVNLRKYKSPGINRPPFVAFRGYIIPKSNSSIVHATNWGLLPYRGTGKYKITLVAGNGYNIQKGDRVSYYVSLRSRDVTWSASYASGVIVLE